MIRQVVLSAGRFFAFFFTLVTTIAVVIASYSAVAGQPVDKTWSAVEALIIAAIVLLILAIAAAALDDYFDRSATRRATPVPPAGTAVEAGSGEFSSDG